ncbi:hypothetical protein [Fusibacter ferrireducens]|uniref:Copper amine oxidase-like N-terminal domain-containing protein n=1 Tax=Fusibacter ferrireducens TaxID=2785058 RepID=A0ABR9ZT51_9FIRM|nr:hypothetical protein [Fusibacter ferrireducens]MBF4693623.1 hypothetical protein [Fusibacter ferrireducens]
MKNKILALFMVITLFNMSYSATYPIVEDYDNIRTEIEGKKILLDMKVIDGKVYVPYSQLANQLNVSKSDSELRSELSNSNEAKQKSDATESNFITVPETDTTTYSESMQNYSPVENLNPPAVSTVFNNGEMNFDFNYTIDYNPSVGNEWGAWVSINGEYYYSHSTKSISVTGEDIVFDVVVYEHDDAKSDFGSGQIIVPYSDISTGIMRTYSTNILVTENGGKYSGNTASITFYLMINTK